MIANIDYKKGVLFIRIKGVLTGNKCIEFENKIIPIVFGLESKYITINMSNVKDIDLNGINSFVKLSNIVSKWSGKVALCELNKNIDDFIRQSDIFDYCFKTKNELTAIGVFRI